MKILLFPTLRKHYQSGFGFIELLVTTSVGALVIIAAIAILNGMTKGFWLFKVSVGLVSQGREAFDLISKDFKNAKASTMGNLAQNPGFESPVGHATSPVGWDNIVLCSGIKKRMEVGSVPIKTGISSMELTANSIGDIAYYGDTVTIPGTGKYIISGWTHSGGNTAKIGLVKENNIDFAPAISQTSTSNYWVHLTTTVVLNDGQKSRLKNSVPPSNWSLVLNTGTLGVATLTLEGMCIYNDQLFLGSWEAMKVYAYDGVTPFLCIATLNGGGNPHIKAMCVYDDGSGEKLVAGSTTIAYWGQGNLFQHTGTNPTLNWGGFAPTAPPFTQYWGGAPFFYGRQFESAAVYNGKLYIGGRITNPTEVPSSYAAVFEYDPTKPPANRWSIILKSTADNFFSYLYVFNDGGGDKLYAGTTTSGRYWHLPHGPNGKIFVLDGDNWIDSNPFTPEVDPVFVAPTGPIWSMTSYKHKLYIGAYDLYVYDGLAWTKLNTGGGFQVTNICWYQGKLYGISNEQGWGWGANTGRLLLFDDAAKKFIAITQPGGWATNLIEYKDDLYLTTQHAGSWMFLKSNTGARMWRMGSKSYFDDVSISPEEVVFENSTAAMMNTYSYYISKGNSESEIDRFKLHRLRYEVVTGGDDPAAPGRLYREFSTDNGTTWTPYGLSATGIICENVKKFRIINHHQESFEVELVLEKEIQKGKVKTHILRTSITPHIS